MALVAAAAGAAALGSVTARRARSRPQLFFRGLYARALICLLRKQSSGVCSCWSPSSPSPRIRGRPPGSGAQPARAHRYQDGGEKNEGRAEVEGTACSGGVVSPHCENGFDANQLLKWRRHPPLLKAGASRRRARLINFLANHGMAGGGGGSSSQCRTTLCQSVEICSA